MRAVTRRGVAPSAHRAGATGVPVCLSGRETACWYAIAFVTYVGASIGEKGLLNWVVGPAWVVGVVAGGPPLWRKVRRR